MRAIRTLFLFLLLTAVMVETSQGVKAQQPGTRQSATDSTTRNLKLLNSARYLRTEYPASANPDSGGIREVIDNRYKQRYEDWKNEFLSTEIGRAQWELYTKHPHLVVTISIAGNNKNGAGTGMYKWNDQGDLIAATIVLGSRIDEGFPSSVYYPVMNSLESYESNQLLGHNVLAATKI